MHGEMKDKRRMTPTLSREQYGRFVQAHETVVYTFCVYMLGDEEQAEAVARAAFVDSYPTDTCLQVLANAYRRCMRAQPATRTAVGVPPMLGQLDRQARALIALRYACHLRPDELAAVTGESQVEVRRQLNRARLQMATQLTLA